MHRKTLQGLPVVNKVVKNKEFYKQTGIFKLYTELPQKVSRKTSQNSSGMKRKLYKSVKS